jgi:hypothetical protein
LSIERPAAADLEADSKATDDAVQVGEKADESGVKESLVEEATGAPPAGGKEAGDKLDEKPAASQGTEETDAEQPEPVDVDNGDGAPHSEATQPDTKTAPAESAHTEQVPSSEISDRIPETDATNTAISTPKKSAPAAINAERRLSTSAASPSPLTTVHLQETISVLRTERTELAQRIASLEGELAIQKRNGSLLTEGQALIKGLEEDKDRLQSRVQELEGEAEEMSRLRAEVKAAKATIGEGEKERARLENDLKNAKEEQGKTAEETKRQIAEAHKESERGREREAVLEQEVARLRTVSAG